VYTCTAARTRPREKILAAYDAAAAASIPHWEASAVALLPRMRWWVILRLKPLLQTLQQRGAELPALKPLDSLLRATVRNRSKIHSPDHSD